MRLVFSVIRRAQATSAETRWFGLDALRALAVLMVVVYHLNLAITLFRSNLKSR